MYTVIITYQGKTTLHSFYTFKLARDFYDMFINKENASGQIYNEWTKSVVCSFDNIEQ